MPLAEAPAQPASVQHAPAHHAAARFDRIERTVFRAVNRARRRHGLGRLRLIPSISFVAAFHSQDQAINRFVSHSSSDGTPFYARIRRVARARAVGETIIEYRGRCTGRGIVRAWMHSPPHRRELLMPSYRRVGIGHVTVRGMSVVTADFASR
ncbi:MAG: CAP domain-containing protein [Solirubrobacteraceae bacterium]